MRKILLSIILFLSLAATSCDETFKSSVPGMAVNFSCSLQQAPYSLITTPGQFLTVRKSGSGYIVNVPGQPAYTDGKVGVYLGYGGLIIGYPTIDFGGGSQYVAYDLACPVEADDLNISRLNLDGSGSATCPKCNTVYSLDTGFPKEGIGKERLKTYSIYASSTQTGTSLTVKN